MSVPLVDLGAQHASLGPALEAAVEGVVASQAFVLGATVQRFERALAAACGAAHAAGVASGSDALFLALRACDVGPGDAVLVPSFTFVATAEAIARTGARPVFVDIEPRAMTLDPDRVEEALAQETPPARVRAILPVHLFGQCADLGRLGALARSRGLALVEDAAQAIGARCTEGPAGAVGRAGALSFFPTKNLGAFGDGGAVLTADDAIDARVRRLRQHGLAGPKDDEHYLEIGLNSRLDALQAAVLEVKLAHLEGWNARRRAIAARYQAGLAELADTLTLPLAAAREGDVHAFNQYVVRTPRRGALHAWLTARGVGSRVYYARPLHQQPCFGAHAGARLPETERASREALALPMYAELADDAVDRVVDAVRAFVREG